MTGLETETGTHTTRRDSSQSTTTKTKEKKNKASSSSLLREEEQRSELDPALQQGSTAMHVNEGSHERGSVRRSSRLGGANTPSLTRERGEGASTSKKRKRVGVKEVGGGGDGVDGDGVDEEENSRRSTRKRRRGSHTVGTSHEENGPTTTSTNPSGSSRRTRSSTSTTLTPTPTSQSTSTTTQRPRRRQQQLVVLAVPGPSLPLPSTSSSPSEPSVTVAVPVPVPATPLDRNEARRLSYQHESVVSRLSPVVENEEVVVEPLPAPVASTSSSSRQERGRGRVEEATQEIRARDDVDADKEPRVHKDGEDEEGTLTVEPTPTITTTTTRSPLTRSKYTIQGRPSTSIPALTSTRRLLTRSSLRTPTATTTIVAASTGGSVLRAKGSIDKDEGRNRKGKGKEKVREASRAARKGKGKERAMKDAEEATVEDPPTVSTPTTNPTTSRTTRNSENPTNPTTTRTTRNSKKLALSITTTATHPTHAQYERPSSPLSPLSPLSTITSDPIEPALASQADVATSLGANTLGEPDSSSRQQAPRERQAPVVYKSDSDVAVSTTTESEAGPGPSTLAMRDTRSGRREGESTLVASTSMRGTRSSARKVEGGDHEQARERPREKVKPYPSTRSTRSNAKVARAAEEEAKVKQGVKGKGKAKASVGEPQTLSSRRTTSSSSVVQPTTTRNSSSPERTVDGTHIGCSDGNCDGRGLEKSLRERGATAGEDDKEGEGAMRVEELGEGSLVTPVEGPSSLGVTSESSSLAGPGPEEGVRRSTRPRVKSAKLIMAEKEAKGGQRVGKSKKEGGKEKKDGGKGKQVEGKRKEKEKEKEKEVEMERSNAPVEPGPSPELPQNSESEPQRGRSRVRDISIHPRSRSPSRSRSRAKSMSPSRLSSSTSSSSSAQPPPAPGQGPAAVSTSVQPPLDMRGRLIRSSPLRELAVLDTASLERLDGLERAERVETPRSFTPMPSPPPTSPVVGNSIEFNVPSTPVQVESGSAAGGIVKDGEEEGSQPGDRDSDRDDISDDMPRSAPDPMFGSTSLTTEEELRLSSSPPHITTTTDMSQYSHSTPPDPLFQVSSESEIYPWTGGHYDNEGDPYRYVPPSPAPSTIAPNSPYLGPAGFSFNPSNTNNDENTNIDSNDVPSTIRPETYYILVSKRFPLSHRKYNPQNPPDPTGIVPSRMYFYHRTPKPPATSPPLTEPHHIARPDLSHYPPHKWLTSFDPGFVEKSGGEHQYPLYPPCDLNSPAFTGAKSSSALTGSRRLMQGAGIEKIRKVGGRETTCASQRPYLDHRVRKTVLRQQFLKSLGIVIEDEGVPESGSMGESGQSKDGKRDEKAGDEAMADETDAQGEGENDEDMEEVVVHSSSPSKKTRREKLENVDPNKRAMVFRPRSFTSPYLKELFESGVEGLMITEDVRWEAVRIICEEEASEYWAKYGLPRPWRVAYAGPWKKTELLHRDNPVPPQGFAQLLEPILDNPDDMDYQNEPTYPWEIASDEDDDDERDEEGSSDIDVPSDVMAEELQIEDSLIESESEDDDDDVEEEEGPVHGEMQLDIQAPVDEWNPPAEQTYQPPMSISPASTLLSSFQPSSSSLADALTPPASLALAPTPAQLMEPPQSPTPAPPGGMMYDFALSFTSRSQDTSTGSQPANVSNSPPTPVVPPVVTTDSDSTKQPTVMDTRSDRVLTLPAYPISRYFSVKKFEDSLNPLLFDPDWWPFRAAEERKRSHHQMQTQTTPQREGTPVSPTPFDYFPASPSSSATSTPPSAVETTPATVEAGNKSSSPLPFQPQRRAWMLSPPVRRTYYYYSEKLGHLRVGTAPDPNRLRQWAVCAEEVEKREKGKKELEDVETRSETAKAGGDGSSDDTKLKTRKGKVKAGGGKATVKAKSKAKGKAKATDAELEEDAKQDQDPLLYDEEAALQQAIESSIIDRHGQTLNESLPRIGSAAWYDLRADTNFPQGQINGLHRWREMFGQGLEVRDTYGYYQEPPEFQQGSSRGAIGYSTTSNSTYPQTEYYQQYDATNPYVVQDQSTEMSQNGSTHPSAGDGPPHPNTDENHEMTDEGAESNVDPNYDWSFLGSLGGGDRNASTTTTSASSSENAGSSPSAATTTPSSIVPNSTSPIERTIDPVLQQSSSNSQLYPSMQQPPSVNGPVLNGNDGLAQNQSQIQNRLQHVNPPSGGGDVSMYGMLNMGLSVGHQGAVNIPGINVSNLSGMGVGVMNVGFEFGFGLGIVGGFGMNQNIDDVEPWYLSNAGSSPPAGIITDGSDGQRSPPQPSVPSQSCSRSSSPASSPIGMGMDVDPPSPGEQRLGSRSPSERESPHPLGFAMG